MSKRSKVATGSRSATSNIVFFENALSDMFQKRKSANSQSSNSTDSTEAVKLLPLNKSQLSKLTHKTSSPSHQQLQASRHQQNQHLQKSQSSNSTDSTKAVKLLPLNKSQLSKLTHKTSSPSQQQLQLQASRHQQNQHLQKSQSSLASFTSAANSKLPHKTSSNQIPNRNLPTNHASQTLLKSPFNQSALHDLQKSPTTTSQRSFTQGPTALQKPQSQSKLPEIPSTSTDSSSSVSSTGTQLPKRNLPVIISSETVSPPLVIEKSHPSTSKESFLTILNLIRDGQRQIAEEIKELNKKIDNIEKKSDANFERLRRQIRGKLKGKPDFLPLKTLDDVKKFEFCDESSFDDVCEYFSFLGGGLTLQECTTRFLRESLDCNKELLRQLTWMGQGAHKNGLTDSKIIKACHEAALAATNIPKFTKYDFDKCMERSLRCLKEQLRRSKNKSAAGTNFEGPPQKKLRRRSTPDDGLDTTGEKIDDETDQHDRHLFDQDEESEKDDGDEQQPFVEDVGNGGENEDHDGRYYNNEVPAQLMNYDSEDMTTQNIEYVNNESPNGNNGVPSDEDLDQLLEGF